MNLSPQQIDAAVNALVKEFGHQLQLERDVLISVLEVHGGDVNMTIQFLRAGQDDMIDPGANPNANGLPEGYMTKPANWVAPKKAEESIDPESLEGKSLKLKQNILTSDTSFLQHFESMDEEGYPLYLGVLLLLVEQGVDIPAPAKGKILAACWARKKWDLGQHLLTRPNYVFGLPEVLRAVKILDLPRKIRQFNKKIKHLAQDGTTKGKTIQKIKGRLNELSHDYEEAHISSVNGALVKRIKRWVRSIPKEHLEFFALQLPKEPWRELADVCHFKPTDFAVEWFLPVCFGTPAPEDSLLGSGCEITPKNVVEMVKKHHIPYSFLRKQVQQLSPEVRALVAEYEMLSMVIWYYEELECPEVDKVLTKRLVNGEEPDFAYGKLMERLLYMKMNNKHFSEYLIPVAEKRLNAIKLPLEPPVVVLGDASYSMDVAIRVSTIIASLLTVLSDAEIQFFNVETFAPENIPRTIPQVLDVATKTKANGLTAPACTLREYYNKKKVVKFFIIVTDEIENDPDGNDFFAQLFYKYYTEVHQAKIVFVSFLEDPNVKGRMVNALESFGIEPLQFRLDATRPDLTKLDSLLGILSAETNFFAIQAHALGESYKAKATIEDLLKQIREGPAEYQKQLRKNVGLDNNNNQDGKGKEEEDNNKKVSIVEQFRALSVSMDGQDIPGDLLCPITGELMEDPVVAADGHTYERSAISEWFQTKSTSPMTGAQMSVKMLFPNHSIRRAVLEWVEAYNRNNKK